MVENIILNLGKLICQEGVQAGAIGVLGLHLVCFEIPMVFGQHYGGGDVGYFPVFYDAEMNWGFSFFIEFVFAVND
jgi:hypothetical protein